MKKVAILAGLASLAMASGASAEGWYGQVSAGMGMAGKAEVDLSVTDGTDTVSASEDLDLESGWLVSGAFGRQAGALRWEGELLYSTNDIDNITLTDGTEELEVSGLSVSQVAGLVNVYYDFQTESAFTPYVGAGVGYGVTRFKADDEDEVDSGLVWQLKAGASIKASDTVSWDIGYRYINMADFETSYEEAGFGVDFDVKSHVHAITVGARFGF